MSTDLAVQHGPVATITQGFGEHSIHTGGQMQSTAIAAREQAVVQARYVVAMQRPRNIDTFRLRILHECKRPGFAAVAMYAKPMGKKQVNGKWEQQYITGASIRFVESAMQCFGNIYPEATTVYDDAFTRTIRVTVSDLENNYSVTTEVTIRKAVERKGNKLKNGEWEPPAGRDVLGQRLNSYGEPTYLVVATDDEVTVRQNSEISKAMRTAALRIIPRDIVDEAIEQINYTIESGIKEDPDKAKKALLDSFAALSVMPVDVAAYLGHDVSKVSPAQLVTLRKIYSSIKSGETTWAEVMDEGASDSPDPEISEKLRAAKVAESEEALAKLKARKAEEQPQASPAQDPPADGANTEPEKAEAKTTTKPLFGGKKQ